MGPEKAFGEAHERGRDPVPGLALLLLAQGKADAAANFIKRALAASHLPLDRARLLPSKLESPWAAADLEGARISVEELESIASRFGSAALRAASAHAQGSLDSASHDCENARINLHRALQLWLEVDLPYEAAMTRVLLAGPIAERGDTASADLELRAARSAFEKLSARGYVV